MTNRDRACRLGRILLAGLILLLTISGCEAKPVVVENGPVSEIPGYYALGQTLEGGVDMPELILSRIDASVHEGETLVSFTFSQASGDPLTATPRYSVVSLDGPARLKIIAPADAYEYQDTLPAKTGLLWAMYAQPATEIDDSHEIYLQFTGNIAFRAVEEQGSLILHILPADPDLRERHFAVMPLDEHTRPIAKRLEMTPVLCENGEQMLYISKPFDKLEDADALTMELNDRLDRAQYNERAAVVMQAGNQAPAVLPIITRAEINRLGALRAPDGSIVTAEPWAVDARFLCWMPDGKTALCAQPFLVEESGETRNFEQLWAYSEDGTRYRFNDSDPVYVHKALFSPDGRYLAMVERNEGNQLLYMYDTLLGMMEFPSAEGMGDFTVGLDWNSDGKLYAMSGDEEMRLLVFDPEQRGEEQSRIRMVEEEIGSRGSVYCAGGLIYFSDVSLKKIMVVDPASGAREEFADGVAFSISPNGKYMMLTYEKTDGESAAQSGMRIKNMDTGEEHDVSADLPYRDSCWALDGETLHYLVMNEDDEDYPSLLYTARGATGELTLEGALASDAIHTGAAANELILVSYYEREGDDWEPITYRLKID